MISFSDALDAFLSDPRTRGRLKPSTLRAYGKDLAAAAAALPVSLADLTGATLGRYLDADIAPSTAARRLAALRALCAWATREGYLVADPTVTLEAPRRPRRLPRPIRAEADRQAVARAIAAAPQPFRLALTILRETGMRAGEALALNLGDVLLDAGREALHVRDPKNRTERVVVLGPTATPRSLRGLRAQLRERAGEPAHAPLLRSSRGTRLSYDALHYQWGQACVAAGLADDAGAPRYTLHQLRHTRATELVEQGPAPGCRPARPWPPRPALHPGLRRARRGPAARGAGAVMSTPPDYPPASARRPRGAADPDHPPRPDPGLPPRALAYRHRCHRARLLVPRPALP